MYTFSRSQDLMMLSYLSNTKIRLDCPWRMIKSYDILNTTMPEGQSTKQKYIMFSVQLLFFVFWGHLGAVSSIFVWTIVRLVSIQHTQKSNSHQTQNQFIVTVKSEFTRQFQDSFSFLMTRKFQFFCEVEILLIENWKTVTDGELCDFRWHIAEELKEEFLWLSLSVEKQSDSALFCERTSPRPTSVRSLFSNNFAE